MRYERSPLPIRADRPTGRRRLGLSETANPGEHLPGSPIRRVAARFVDAMLCGLVVTVGFTVAYLALEAARPHADREVLLSPLVRFLGPATVAVSFLYEVVCIAVADGRTVGKKAFGLRVVYNVRSPLVRARDLVERRATSWVGWLVVRGLLCPLAVESAVGLVSFDPRVLAGWAGVSETFVLLNLAMVVVDRTGRRTLHDRLTGTLVVAA
jgi:uncharacterized RDD family membrane protein YckC